MAQVLFRLTTLAFWLGCVSAVSAAIVFQDGFETGTLGVPWSTSATNNGRATVISDYSPASGDKHLVLDDSVNDNINSVSEATLTFDLTYKKNVVLTFKAKSLGNEPNNPPTFNFSTTRAYDGVAISANGGATWRTVQSLANVATDWLTYTITLDASVAALGGSFGQDFRIRFSEYDNSPAPLDGIAFDDVLVTADDDLHSSIEVPSPLIEGTGPQTGYVILSFTPANDLTLDLVTSPTAALSIPATITVPAGQTSASFSFSVPDDNVTNLTRDVTIRATAPNITADPGTVTIYDDEAPTPTITLPAQFQEGVYIFNQTNATISISHAASQPLTLYLTDDPALLSHSYSIMIPAGQTQVAFTVYAYDDYEITGNRTVTMTSRAPGIPTASAQTVVIDNEARTLAVSLPATVQEDGVATGTVSIPGTLQAPLVVNLANSSPAAATVPPSVTIPTGSVSNTFTFAPHDNSIRDGSRNVMITVEANTFSSASAVITLRDNEIAGYRVAVATDIVNVSSPASFTLSATDIEGNAIAGGSNTVNVAVVRPDGTTLPASPPTLTRTGTVTTGTVTLPPGLSPPLRLRVTDADGNSGDSQAFDLLRTLSLTAADLAWDASRNRFYASVPSTAPSNANQVVAIDAATLQITGSVMLGQNPGQLALTSGAEVLYVALNANGMIVKIDPQTMKAVSSFAVGSSPNEGTLFAADTSSVAGQPNLLIVARRPQYSGANNSIVVFDNGVALPNAGYGNGIEPSADPAVYFASSPNGGMSRYLLDANGLSFIVYNRTMPAAPAMVADGNIVVSGPSEIDGANLRLLGSFGSSTYPGFVAWRPDLATNRVYFIEPQTTSYGSPIDKIAAYDPTSLALARRSTMPPVSSAASFIRWGSNGLAFRTANTVAVIGASQLVSSGAPTDLQVNLQAAPASAAVGSSLIYTVQLNNQGPNLAQNTLLTATLSDRQTLQNVTASTGSLSISGSVISLNVGELPAGASATLTITTSPQTAGSVSCTASVSSTALDANFENDSAFKLVPVGFQPARDVVNQIRVGTNNLLYDATRNVIWATIPSSVGGPLGRSIVAIDPASGQLSDPIPLKGNPRVNCFALSGNARFLYVGLTDAPEVLRLDLSSAPYSSVRLPLGTVDNYSPTYAQDIEVLDGDGTSFIVAAANSRGAAVYDGAVQRPTVLNSLYVADRIERTATPSVFVALPTGISSPSLSKLIVTSSGVSVGNSVQSLIGGSEIRASGNLVLSTGGQLANSSTLTLQANFGVSGRPCLDTPNGRGYIVDLGALRAFDTATGNPAGLLVIPDPPMLPFGAEWAQTCIRWGLDGFAIAAPDKVYFARWSAAIPPGVDQDHDFIADDWEARYFGSLQRGASADDDNDGLTSAFEYLFVTSPLQANGSPVRSSVTRQNGSTFIHLVYPRRQQRISGGYTYDVSADITQWQPAQNVTETILGTTTIDGVVVETVDATIPAPGPAGGFARLRWLSP